jgi:nucleotide-binding universal stress UspA family protein
MYKHILLPTDGSRLSGKAIKQGIQLAKSLGANITAFNVVLPYQQLMMDDGLMASTTVDFQKRFYEDSLKRSNLLVDKIKAEANAAGVKCEGVTTTSSVPYEAIVKQARKSKCDLIMMASHGRKGLSSILLGSETSKVLTHSTVPVLVVR